MTETPIYDKMPNRTKVERMLKRPKWSFADADRKAKTEIRKKQRQEKSKS